MNGYLLDNNIISILARPGDPRRSGVSTRLTAIGNSPVFLPVMAIAEIEFGMAKAESPDPIQQAAMRAFFASYPIHLPTDHNWVEPYALVRAELWRRYATRKKRGHREKLPEELVDRVTGKELGIDERDLLIVSVAIQYNLVFATADRNPGMRRIEEAANCLKKQGKPPQLVVEDWLPPP